MEQWHMAKKKKQRRPVKLSRDETLLIDGQEAALVLGRSPMTIKRMRRAGEIHGRQLRPGPTSPFMYLKADIYKLAGIELPQT